MLMADNGPFTAVVGVRFSSGPFQNWFVSMLTKIPVRIDVDINPLTPESRYEIQVVKETSPEETTLVKVAGLTPHDAVNHLRDELQKLNLGALDLPTPDWWASLEARYRMVN